MKLRNLFSSFFLLGMMGIALTSCSKDDEDDFSGGTHVDDKTIAILNENHVETDAIRYRFQDGHFECTDANRPALLRNGNRTIFAKLKYKGKEYKVTKLAYQCLELTNLTSLKISNGITAIDYSAFERCTILKSVSLPSSITTIGHHAFDRCSQIESIKLPDHVKTVEHHLFINCGKLKQVTLPKDVVKMEECVFMYCKSLEKIIYPGTKAQWNKVAKDKDLYYNCNEKAVVVCSDGNIAIK